jgi:hypothetical protein
MSFRKDMPFIVAGGSSRLRGGAPVGDREQAEQAEERAGREHQAGQQQ